MLISPDYEQVKDRLRRCYDVMHGYVVGFARECIYKSAVEYRAYGFCMHAGQPPVIVPGPVSEAESCPVGGQGRDNDDVECIGLEIGTGHGLQELPRRGVQGIRAGIPTGREGLSIYDRQPDAPSFTHPAINDGPEVGLAPKYHGPEDVDVTGGCNGRVPRQPLAQNGTFALPIGFRHLHPCAAECTPQRVLVYRRCCSHAKPIGRI